MKTPCLLIASALAAALLHAESPVISVDRTYYSAQTGASTFTTDSKPYTLNFQIHGSTDMSAWGPAFYKAGSGGTPQSGTSSDTNTGTLNFTATPNNYADYLFAHDFTTNAALESFYPIAPTGGGAYGVKFLGSAPPSPALFTDGLVFAAGITFPSVQPRITTVSNGAVWAGGKLWIRPSGTTTFNFNAFPEYGSNIYGSLITAGFYNPTTQIATAARESGSLPMGDSTEDSAPIFQTPITSIAVDGSWFSPGQTYTLEIQYSTLAGRPEEADLNGVEFQGAAAYRKVTRVTVAVGQPPQADFNGDGKSDILRENTATGEANIWLMNGTSIASSFNLGVHETSWRIATTADFNGDGHCDILWDNTVTGQAYIWLMNGTAMSGGVDLVTHDPSWRIVTAADFNGDGQPDILWDNSVSGQTYLWFMNGTTMSSGAEFATHHPTWRIATAADFNQDGHFDIVWENTATGQGYIWLMNGATKTGEVDLGFHETRWRIASATDFNGDGHSDIVWENTDNGQNYIWLMNGTTMTGGADLGTHGSAWRIAE